MYKIKITLSVIILAIFLSCKLYAEKVINLPEPRKKSNISLEETLSKRRSIREFSYGALTINDISQLLWAAQGITNSKYGRTAPSAGALYPIRVYLIVGNVKNLSVGVYKYEPLKHQIIKIKDGDVRNSLSEAALEQPWVYNSKIKF